MDAPPTTPDIDLAALDSLRDKYIRTDRDDLFRLHLDRMLKRDADDRLLPEPVTFTATGEPRGIALVEGAGGGKTSLVHHGLSTQAKFRRAFKLEAVRLVTERGGSPRRAGIWTWIWTWPRVRCGAGCVKPPRRQPRHFPEMASGAPHWPRSRP